MLNINFQPYRLTNIKIEVNAELVLVGIHVLDPTVEDLMKANIIVLVRNFDKTACGTHTNQGCSGICSRSSAWP
jgi:hypothetical protein